MGRHSSVILFLNFHCLEYSINIGFFPGYYTLDAPFTR